MDPETVLAEIRELAASLLTATDEDDWRGYELAEKVTALDEWLSRGGFLPAAWTRDR